MPRNPYYNADWHTQLAAAETELVKARRDAAANPFGSPQHRLALAWLDAARTTQRNAWRMQFVTIADYAQWKFGELAEARDGFAIDRAKVDFFSIEEVDAAYEYALRDAREGTLEQRFRLETGQPAELTAFADSQLTISSWRQFGKLECMVSFCQGELLFHICLAHPWGGLALKSNEIFRAIATQLARESLILQEPDATVLFREQGHQQAQHRELIRKINTLASAFRFYRHLLPERGLREEFCRVDMVWNGAGWIDPDWSAMVYAKLPVALREAAGQPRLAALPGRHSTLE